MKTQIRRVLALVCVALFAVQVAKAAPAPTPAEIAASHARAVAQRLADWTILHDAHLRGDPHCLIFTHARQVAHKLIFLNPRSSGAQGLSVVGSVSVYARSRDARKALAESGGPQWQSCTLAWDAKQYAAQGMRVTGHAGVPAWAQAPRASHAVAQHIEARAPGSSERISISTYELQDTTDPRVVYGFSISASGKAIPQSLVRTLLGLAA